MGSPNHLHFDVNHVDNDDYFYIADRYCGDNSDVRCILMLMMMTIMITFILMIDTVMTKIITMEVTIRGQP